MTSQIPAYNVIMLHLHKCQLY